MRLSLTTLLAAALFTLTLAGASARAVAQREPELRLDVGVPNVGVGAATFDPELLAVVGVHVTLAHRSGHGVRVDATLLSPDSGPFLGPHRGHGDATLIDAAYLYRVHLAGNDRLGLGLDLSAGLTGGDVRFRQPTGGFCFSNCPRPDPVEERIADGVHIGPNLGAALDFRAYGFVLGIDVRYRALVGLEARAGDRVDQHALSATASLGFGFW